MSVLMRATIAILLTLTSAFAAVAADKPYHRDDLADTAIRLEGEIRANAGTVGKPLGGAEAGCRRGPRPQRCARGRAGAGADRDGGAGR